MADIPVERRSSSKAWLWLLIALVVIGLLVWWLLSSVDSDDAVEQVNDDAVVSAAEVADPALLTIGEPVTLEGAQVAALVGDAAFTVDHHGKRIPVFFDETPTPGTPTEGLLDINEGMMVNITGEFRSAADLPEGADASILGDSQTYILATEIEPVGD